MIVTISREYGAGGLAVAEGVARDLGFALATDLQQTVATNMGTSPAVASQASIEPSLSERVLRSLGAGTAEITNPSVPGVAGEFDESLRREMERAIRELAHCGDHVILGRSAGLVLAGRSDLLRVFLTAGRAWRVARVVEAFGQSEQAAAADVDRVDSARRKFTKDRYKAAWGDARSYDLMVDTSRFGIAGTVDLIVAAVRALPERAQ